MNDCDAKGAEARAVILPAVFDMDATAELKLVLEAALEAGVGVQIEAGDVQRVTTPGLQLLAVAARSFAERGSAFGFGACAPPLAEGATLLGLAPVLGIDGD